MTAVVAVASKMIITRQSTRALTVSSGMSREKRGGNGASALQFIRFLPQRACLAKWRQVDDGQKRDPGEDHLQTRPNNTGLARPFEVRER